jgi:hypothetical protein
MGERFGGRALATTTAKPSAHVALARDDLTSARRFAEEDVAGHVPSVHGSQRVLRAKPQSGVRRDAVVVGPRRKKPPNGASDKEQQACRIRHHAVRQQDSPPILPRQLFSDHCTSMQIRPRQPHGRSAGPPKKTITELTGLGQDRR